MTSRRCVLRAVQAPFLDKLRDDARTNMVLMSYF